MLYVSKGSTRKKYKVFPLLEECPMLGIFDYIALFMPVCSRFQLMLYVSIRSVREKVQGCSPFSLLEECPTAGLCRIFDYIALFTPVCSRSKVL